MYLLTTIQVAGTSGTWGVKLCFSVNFAFPPLYDAQTREVRSILGICQHRGCTMYCLLEMARILGLKLRCAVSRGSLQHRID